MGLCRRSARGWDIGLAELVPGPPKAASVFLRLIMIAVVRTTVMATKVKTMMTNRLVSKLDAVDLAGG